jgi:hypothetical protein
LFVTNDRLDFAESFNDTRLRMGHRRGKGTFLPLPLTQEPSGLTTLQRMGTYYRHVGEKIALGPQGTLDGQSIQERFLAFQARHFFSATYFLTFRTPAECTWSSWKMFPENTFREVCDCWLQTLKMQLDLLHAFPRAYAIFLENLTPAVFTRINAILDTEIRLGPSMLRAENKRSALAAGEIPPELEPYRSRIERCTKIYEEVKAAFCPKTLTFHESVPRCVASTGGFSAGIQDQIDQLLIEPD